MITTAILYVFYGLVALLLALIPTSGGLPNALNDALSVFITEAVKWNNFIPINQLFIILALVFAIESGFFVFKTINWILGKVRGSN